MRYSEDDILGAMFSLFRPEYDFMLRIVRQLRDDTIIGRDEHGYWYRQPEDDANRRRRGVEH